jgi:hypothetical protein
VAKKAERIRKFYGRFPWTVSLVLGIMLLDLIAVECALLYETYFYHMLEFVYSASGLRPKSKIS